MVIRCGHCGHEMTPGENGIPLNWAEAMAYMDSHIRAYHLEKKAVDHGDVTVRTWTCKDGDIPWEAPGR